MANSYNGKNYAAHGGEEWVIGGKLTFLNGAEVENFPGPSQGPQGAAVPPVSLSVANSVAALREDLNALLRALSEAGVVALHEDKADAAE